MTKQRLGRLAWLARLVVLGGILLLAARVPVPTWTVRDSPVSGHLTALVSCVLPAAVDHEPSTPASVPEAPPPDCDPTTPDRLGTVWMTAC